MQRTKACLTKSIWMLNAFLQVESCGLRLSQETLHVVLQENDFDQGKQSILLAVFELKELHFPASPRFYTFTRKWYRTGFCRLFILTVHTSQKFLDWWREGSVRDSNLGTFVPQSHALLTVPVPPENQCFYQCEWKYPANEFLLHFFTCFPFAPVLQKTASPLCCDCEVLNSVFFRVFSTLFVRQNFRYLVKLSNW